MELNLKYYTGKDKSSDSKIEDKIIKYIKNNSNYEDVILKDKSWPVFYHLSSMRKNVISWYPFKKDATILEVGAGMGSLTDTLCDKCKQVTSVELSKKRATAILERNKDRKNLEIIVGNFNDVKFNKKFDYILLCGVEEYDLNVDLIDRFKSLLTSNGKILIAIENRLGIKYLCGANEDYSDIPFEGINNGSKTFSKNELDLLVKDVGMNANYYYMFPDYKFPQLILTDEGLSKVKNNSYIPYYYNQMELVINERKLFEDIEANNSIPVFANSYFLELSEKKTNKEVEYVKFNFYRKEKYQLNTYLIKDKFYKVANSKQANYQIDSLLSIEKMLDNKGINHLKTYEDNDMLYTKYSNLPTLEKALDEYLKNNEIDKIYEIYDKLFSYYKSILGEEIKPDKTIFDKYDVKVTQQEKEKMHFFQNGFIDIIPSNILVDKDHYVLFDQEWYEENVPIEYLMFRSISYFFDTRPYNTSNIANDLYQKYSVKYELFRTLEDEIVENVHNIIFNKIFKKHTSFDLINVIDKQNHIRNLERINEELNSNLKNTMIRSNKIESDYLNLQGVYSITKDRLNEIENSKGYKILDKFYRIKAKIKKNK